MNARNPMAGGFPFILCIFVGVIAGLTLGEPSLGFLLGAAAGTLIALAIWLLDRRRAP